MRRALDEKLAFLGPLQRVVFELKIQHRGLSAALAEGLPQTVRYADICGADEAHLNSVENDIIWSKSMDLEIYVGQVISIQDDMNEFESGEYKIKELYENYKRTDKINITELEEIDTRFDDHSTWILLESVKNYSCIQCNPLSINIQVDPVTT